jgi:hypothetical protein
MNARRLAATSLLIFTLGLAACGGDNDPAGEPPTTSPPEPADTRPTSPEEANFPASFVKKVEPICEKTYTAIDELAPIEDEAKIKQAASTYDDAYKEFTALKPPAKNAEAYDRFTEIFRDGSRTLDGIAGEMARGDSAASQRVQPAIDQINTEAGSAADDFGFTKCNPG